MLAGPIALDTGWSRSLIYFGFTVALLSMGIVSSWAGRAIDRYGARAGLTFLSVFLSVRFLENTPRAGWYVIASSFVGSRLQFLLSTRSSL